MARAATSRLKVNPPLGKLPVLQYIPPTELLIDATYQRSLDASASKTLIRKIAQFWNWDLCQPLVVSRRSDGGLYVIDGQHRLAASRLRTDIGQLPCVVVEYEKSADEAASFVHLNQQRRPLSALDVFKAAVASEDEEALAIMAALTDVGLSIAPHLNFVSWKPGNLSNIAGIQRAWRADGATVGKLAMRAISEAFSGEILRYAGTIYPGIAHVCKEWMGAGGFGSQGWPRFIKILQSRSQAGWRKQIVMAGASDPNLNFSRASAKVIYEACISGDIPSRQDCPASLPKPGNGLSRNFKPDDDGLSWCDQCDHRVTAGKASSCGDRFCFMRAGPLA